MDWRRRLSPGTILLIQWSRGAAGLVIWLALFLEFVIKSTIAESGLEYAKRSWLDMVIILLLLISFSCPASRSCVSRQAQTGQAFRIRGALMKVARCVFNVVIGLEATDRMLMRFRIRKPTDQKHPDEMTRHELMTELNRMR